MIQSNSAQASATETVRQSVSQVLRDLLTLAELQARLIQSDTRECVARLGRPAAVLAAGAMLLAATVPACLAAIAEGLVAAGVPRAIALMLVALAGVATATGMVTWAWRRIRTMPAAFARSREELIENFTWLKEAMPDHNSPSRVDGEDNQDRSPSDRFGTEDALRS